LFSPRERFEYGDHVKEFFVYGRLPHTVELPIQVFQDVFNILIGTLHRRQTACVLTVQRLRACLKEQHKQVPLDKPLKRRGSSADYLRQRLSRTRLARPLLCSQPFLPLTASVITPKPASHDHLKTGQLQRSGQPFL
jgi:hypothetical protein